MTNQIIHIAVIIGTRPEIIKMAPVIKALRQHAHFKVAVINTGQHQRLLDDMLTLFEITPDIDLNIMKDNQSLSSLTGNLFLKLGELLTNTHYQLIIGQGDTTTSFVSAMIAFYHDIPFAHVEAGLRSDDFRNPFPEEMNRVFISKIAALHFAPTNIEEKTLLSEGVKSDTVFVTGNTVIDALYYVADKKTTLPFVLPANKRIILVTLHRRESFGEYINNIFTALLAIVKRFPDVHIVYPVHPNPNVHHLAYEMLSDNPQITLTEPLRYDVLVSLLKQSYLVCTDSGGIQEEAPALGKPILILREVTERPLVVEMGLGKLVGNQTDIIVKAATELLSNTTAYKNMQKNLSPYGDGHAATRIADIILHYFK